MFKNDTLIKALESREWICNYIYLVSVRSAALQICYICQPSTSSKADIRRDILYRIRKYKRAVVEI